MCNLCVQKKSLIFQKLVWGEKNLSCSWGGPGRNLNVIQSCRNVWTFYSCPIKLPALSWCPSPSNSPSPAYAMQRAWGLTLWKLYCTKSVVKTWCEHMIQAPHFFQLSLPSYWIFVLNFMMMWIDKEQFHVKSEIATNRWCDMRVANLPFGFFISNIESYKAMILQCYFSC